MTSRMLALVARLLVLCALSLSWPAAVLAADAAKSPFEEELAKQREIYHGRRDQRLEGYVIDRTLLSYIHVLGQPFAVALARLGPVDRWIDIGAGRGKAVLDYQAGRHDAVLIDAGWANKGRANSVALSIEDRRTDEWHRAAADLGPEKLGYLFGRSFGDYTAQELGRFQVVTDVIGGFSYTPNLTRFVQRVLEVLPTGGDFFTVLQDVSSEQGSNKPHYEGSPYLTELVNADGSPLKVCSWLKSISCVQVTCALRSDWKPPVEAYHVRKTCEDVKIPPLVAEHYQAGTPPERRFRVQGSPPAAGAAVR